MLSEELLLEIKDIDSETSVEEIISIINERSRRYSGAVRYEWELIADVAFLAYYHKKPRGFWRVVDSIRTLLSICGCIDGSDRAGILIADDAPEEPTVVIYMLGYIKGKLGVAQTNWERMKKKEKKYVKDLMKRLFPGLKLTPGTAI